MASGSELERLEISVGGLPGLVPDAVLAATSAALSADPTVVAGVARWRHLVHELHAELERTVEVLVAR